jgi:hypothetical protein
MKSCYNKQVAAVEEKEEERMRSFSRNGEETMKQMMRMRRSRR